MSGDNGKGLRALFYGLCCLWDMAVWDEDQAGEMPADFYLPYQMGVFVVIVPEPADRQVEIAALQARQEKFIVLDREDIDHLRSCSSGDSAGLMIVNWVRHGTHAGAMRKHLGLQARSGEGT